MDIEIRIREREKDIMQLFKHMINAFVLFRSVFDEQGNFISYRFSFINDAYEKITGVKNDEVYGKTVHEVWPETENEWIERYGKVAMTGEPDTFELFHKPTNKLYRCNVYRPFDNNEQFCVMFEDITTIKKTQNKIYSLYDAAKIVQQLGDFKVTAQKLFNKCKKLTGATSGYVALLSENGEENEVLFLDSGGLACSVDESLPMPIRGLRSEAYKLSKAVYHNDFMNSEHIKFMPEGHMVLKNVMFAPLVINNKTVGLIGIANKPTDFTEDDLEIITPMAELAAVALVNSRNLTELGKTNDELEKINEKFSTIFNMSRAMICVADLNTATFKFINPSFLRVLGYNNQELLDQPFLNFIHPDDVQDTLNVIEEELKKEKQVISFENRYKCKNGDYVWLSWNSFPKVEKGITYAIANDITEIKNNEQELLKAKERVEESEAFFKLLFEKHNAIMLLINHVTGSIIKANRAAVDFYGYPEEDLLLMKIQNINTLSDEQIEQERLNALMYHKNYFIFDHELASGERKIVEVHSSPIIYKKKKVLFSIIHDVTDRKEQEKQTILAKEAAEKSDRLKTAFLNNLSHEIRTPLNGIMGFAQLLYSNKDISKSKIASFSKIIWENSDRLLNVIDDILKISKLDTGNIEICDEEIDVDSFLESIELTFKSEIEHNKLKLLIDNNKKTRILSDEQKIFQIFSNLIQNAIKFTDEGVIQLNCLVFEEKVRFSVKDEGIGIKEQDFEKIFERFGQTEMGAARRYGGTGLGLSIAKGFVELLGGKIWCESEMGKGSEFFFEIPAKILEVKEKKNDVDNQSLNEEIAGGLSFLVAEDEYSNFVYLNELIDSERNSIVHVYNGKDAVDFFKKGKSFDIVLMDLKMPVMGGLEATEEIKKINPKQVIIAQTAYATSYDEKKCIEAGCNAYISKPINPQQFYALVNQYKKKKY